MSDLPADSELLRDYATSRSQAAFAQIVRRHVDLVYSAAKRQVRDAHLAEDVTQAVFLILSQKASSIGSGVSLAGWLYNTTRYAANNARRGEIRRTHHEHKAGEAMRDAASSIKTWKQIEPGLDAAVAKLPSRDREAVMLRFFRQLSLKDVGAALGVSEDAAKVRVSRAIARLRHLLGAATPAAALSVMLADNALHAAPPGLADSTITLTSGSPVPTAVTTIAKGALTVMRYAQLKLAAAVVVALVVSGAAVGFVVRQLAGPAGQVVAPQAVKTLAGSPEQTAPAGRSTPASALRTLMQEILAGTDHGRGWIAESDLERDAGEAVSDMIYQAEQLRIAAQKQFNQSITVPLAVNLPRPQQLDGSAVRETFIDDDHAAVDAGAGTLKVVMMRIDDQWRLPVDGLASAAHFADVEAMRDECQRLFEGFRSIKTDLENEQFQSSRELDEAIRELISRKP